jgi:hypothetical protein
MGKTNKALILTLFLSCLEITARLYPAGAEVTRAELDGFRLTIHKGDELFPFRNLVTMEGQELKKLLIKA